MTNPDLIPKSYWLDRERGVFIEQHSDGKWSASCAGEVLNSQGQWEWEPLPSNRDEDFLKRTRFDTTEEIVELYAKTHGDCDLE